MIVLLKNLSSGYMMHVDMSIGAQMRFVLSTGLNTLELHKNRSAATGVSKKNGISIPVTEKLLMWEIYL